MTQEERDIIVNFIARISGGQAAGAPSGGAFASVPSTAPALPPVDPAADALIGEQLARFPEARYRITQLAFVQEHALAEAQNRIKRLEWEVQQAQQAAQQAQAAAQQAAAQPQPQPSRGFLGGLFGGSAPPPPAPPQGVWNQGGSAGYQAPPPPQYAPGYQPGMFQRQGSGFLGSALTTAAGVAGGLVVGNALMDLFSPHRAEAAPSGFMPAAPAEGAASSPWASSPLPEPPTPPEPGYVDQSGWTTPDQTAQTGGSTDDNSWAQPQPDPSNWADNSGGGDSGWGNDPGGADDDNSMV
jgi:hypothetical protein